MMFLVEAGVRYSSTIADAGRAAQSYADLLSEHTARTFEGIERTLMSAESVRNNLNPDQPGGRAAITEALRNLCKSSPGLLAIGWTNAAGDVIASSYQGSPVRPNIADLDHFKVQRDGIAHGFYVAPLFRSKVSDRWISSVSLRLDNPDESFAGVVTAPLDFSYFARIYRMVQLGSNATVTLLRMDGTVLTREPFVESAVGQSFRQAGFYREHLSQKQAGIFETRSPIDGRDRIVAFRAVPGLPLIMLVSADREELLSLWNRRVRTAGALIGLLIAGVLIGTFLLSRRSNQLLEKTSMLEATLGNMHQGMIVVDKSDRIVLYNRQAVDLLDLPEQMMRSNPMSRDVIAYQAGRGDFANVDDDIKDRLLPNNFGQSNYAYERERADGTILSVRIVPSVDGGTIRTFTNITQRKLLERELGERERQFRLLAENTTDIIARLGFGGRLLYVSPSANSVLGYHPDELTGVKVTDFIHEDDVRSVVKFFARILKGAARGQTTAEYRFLHKDGRWIWLETSPTLVLDAEGKAYEFVDVVRDITKRKVIEAEAEASRQKAELAARAQGQFLATMSHELRTPLNSIVGFADIVLDRIDLHPEARRQIELIQTASDSLLTVVNDILDFSKIEDGKMELIAVDFDLAKLVEDSVSIVRGAAIAKQLDLRVSIDKAVSRWLVGDDHRLRQVLLNLLNNAIKFTRHGHVALGIERSDATDKDNELRFSVSDTGIGISEDRFDILFQRFSQVDGTTSREFGGSGLGLAISKLLVEAMGGQITVASTPGKGSTFSFTAKLPVGKDVRAETPAPALPSATPSLRRVLLVEDVEVNREIALASLEHCGYRVDVAVNGADAVALVLLSDYDLVLMDIQMPVMDGITATARIRALAGAKANIPILAMTANVLPTQLEAFRSVGMNGHIGKPFRRADLIAAIETCLAPARAPDFSDAGVSISPASSDSQAFTTLAALLGPVKIEQLLDKLRQQMSEFVGKIPYGDQVELRREAHKLIASAGMLGFASVSKDCASLEERISAGDDVSALLEDVRAKCLTALDEISIKSGRTLTAREDPSQSGGRTADVR